MIVDASAIDDSIEPLRALTRDKTPAVRERLYTLAKEWLTELMDRHVYGVKIVPFLYAGVSDELPKLSALCIDYLDQVGAQYEKEHNVVVFPFNSFRTLKISLSAFLDRLPFDVFWCAF